MQFTKTVLSFGPSQTTAGIYFSTYVVTVLRKDARIQGTSLNQNEN